MSHLPPDLQFRHSLIGDGCRPLSSYRGPGRGVERGTHVPVAEPPRRPSCASRSSSRPAVRCELVPRLGALVGPGHSLHSSRNHSRNHSAFALRPAGPLPANDPARSGKSRVHGVTRPSWRVTTTRRWEIQIPFPRGDVMGPTLDAPPQPAPTRSRGFLGESRRTLYRVREEMRSRRPNSRSPASRVESLQAVRGIRTRCGRFETRWRPDLG
jgi:hypothetical protein